MDASASLTFVTEKIKVLIRTQHFALKDMMWKETRAHELVVCACMSVCLPV